MWSNWLVFCHCGFSLSALWCPLSVPTILLGFLLPWTWGISSRLLQQSTSAAPDLGYGLSPHSCSSWLWLWVISSWPPLLTLDVWYLLPTARCTSVVQPPLANMTLVLVPIWNSSEVITLRTLCLLHVSLSFRNTLLQPLSGQSQLLEFRVIYIYTFQNYGKFLTHMTRFLSSIFISLFNLPWHLFLLNTGQYNYLIKGESNKTVYWIMRLIKISISNLSSQMSDFYSDDQ